MNFIDRVKLTIQAGHGGNGHKSFRHEKFISKGGPDGGDGGKGGDIIFKANPNLDTLASFRFKKKLEAQNGHEGGKSRKHGKNGQDLIVLVPPGTVISTLDGKILADLVEPHQEEIIAQGGLGGFGNAHFVSSIRQAPDFAEKGEPGEALEINLELKLIADIGLIGLPNAGKSTLLSKLSNARPEIADYPFTTLVPNLGVLDLSNQKSVLLADIPGLIEGASLGKGLGVEFLKHIERTRSLIHVLDYYQEDIVLSYQIIRKELGSYNPKLTKLPEIVVLNKCEGVKERDIALKIALLKKVFTKIKVIPISAIANQGLDQLKQEILSLKNQFNKKVVKRLPTISLNETKQKQTKIIKIKDLFILDDPKMNRFALRTDFSNPQSVQRLKDILKKEGHLRVLLKKGLKSGSIIQIGSKDNSFKY